MPNIITPEELRKSAVIVIDIQNDFCHPEGVFAQYGLDIKPAQEVAQRILFFIEEVRKSVDFALPIIYTQQIEAPDLVAPNLQAQFDAGKLSPVCAPDSWGAGLYLLEPTTDEHVITKHTYDAFSNPQLENILRELGTKTVIVTGVNTDVCVDSTVRSAFTKGFHVIVPKDLVATPNTDASEHYLAIFDRFLGKVTDASAILSALAA